MARFDKSRRVRRRGDFQQVFDRGARVHGRYMTVLTAAAPGAHCRLGIVASKKLGGAVVRNKAKRLIREVFRNNPPSVEPAVDILVIPRRELLTANYPDIEDDFKSVCRRVATRAIPAGPRRR
ncbi:MAG: ribonuclease P protein component [Vicinamibacterales bacterium]|jgi:ribonuclease P protein component